MELNKELGQRLEVGKEEIPNLYRDIFPHSSLPKIEFEDKAVPMNLPEDIWITDTTFRDGQQAREPYTTDEMVHLFELMHRLGGEYGVIRYTEFFLYTKRDRDAAERCLELGYEYPRVTSWIRARRDDLELV